MRFRMLASVREFAVRNREPAVEVSAARAAAADWAQLRLCDGGLPLPTRLHGRQQRFIAPPSVTSGRRAGAGAGAGAMRPWMRLMSRLGAEMTMDPRFSASPNPG